MADVNAHLENLVLLPEYQVDWDKNVPYAFGPLGIVIEYLAGDVRTKVKETVVITNVMPSAYGYILRTTDIHGEEIDMYLASMPNRAAPVFIIDQIHPNGQIFDEHKVMLGFESIEEVVDTYVSVFGDGSGSARLGAVTQMTMDQFLGWITLDGASTQPASKYGVEGVQTTSFHPINLTPNEGAKPIAVPRDEVGGVIIPLTDLSKGPKLITTSKEAGVFEFHLYFLCGLEMMVWSSCIDNVVRTLMLASDKDTFHIHIASPGGSVILMSRLKSAIKATKATVITYAQGCVASAATTIWAAGHKRYILPGAYFMQHMSSQFLGGKTTDIAAKADFCVKQIERVLDDILAIGLFTPQEIKDMVEKSADIYVSGRDAIRRVGAVSTNKEA